MAPGSEAPGLRTHPLSGLVQGGLYAAAGVAGLASSLLGDGWGDVPLPVVLPAVLLGGLALGVLAGYVSWWFTTYVIDGTELRIQRGVLTKSSRRIPYERIQSVDVAEPLLARVVGLAELRIEMAGGSDSRSSLRFLSLRDTYELRRILLARAHGVAVEEEPDHRDRLVTRVPPGRIVIGTVLSLDFLGAAVGTVALVVAAVWFEQVVVLLGGVLGLGTWLVRIVLRRIVLQWDFTLTRTERGLRIERGLLSRTSQTIPVTRVQGIVVTEPYVWRRFGWQRLDVDVAGTGARGDGEDSEESTLLPIADPPLAAAVVAELVGSVSGGAESVRAPRRSWVFAPIGWRYRWVAPGDETFVASTGWITRRTDVVPHGKTQSVEIRQGPWARRRHLATVELHTPQGVVDADGRNLAADDARHVALTQLARARAHRP